VQIRHRAQVIRDYGSVRLVQGNASRLSQVFLNLIVNAAQALPENARGNEIRIRTRMDESGLVAVTVSDTGPGIAPEALSKLFVPFFTTKQVGVGTGLGLSICERLVRASGGRIEVESQLGQGATFRVQLQPADTSSGVPAPAPAQSRQSAVRRARILMVDDEPMILSILSRALASEHDCVPAMTGLDALSKIAAGERFDVIFCDLVMPGMNGMDLYGALQREAPDQADRVVFLTGGAVTSEVQEFLSTVPNSRIEKPFSLAQLQTQVRARLR
jgi:CheY-like chemotaxis protein/anti-sigma regulatory factor (Ser/Thr protein kinase)